MGCDLFEDIDCEGGNYITVSVSANVHAQVLGGPNETVYDHWSGVELEIEIIKAGGERETFNRVANEYGDITEMCQATFKVYKEQDVVIKVTAVSGVIPIILGGAIYDPHIHYDTGKAGDYHLTWDRLKDCNWGDTYYWSPRVIFQLNVP